MENNKYSLLEVKNHLKEGEILQTLFAKEITTVYFKDLKFHCKNRNISLVLSEKDFIKTFADCDFFEIQNEEGIDEEKDKEYYSWRQ